MEPEKEKSDFAADSMAEKTSENAFAADLEKNEGTIKAVHLQRRLQSRHLQMIAIGGEFDLVADAVSLMLLSNAH